MAVTGSGRVPEVCLNKLAGLCEFSFEKNARLTVDKAFRCLLHATKTIRQKSMSSPAMEPFFKPVCLDSRSCTAPRRLWMDPERPGKNTL